MRVILNEPIALISLNLLFVMCRWCAGRSGPSLNATLVARPAQLTRNVLPSPALAAGLECEVLYLAILAE